MSASRSVTTNLAEGVDNSGLPVIDPEDFPTDAIALRELASTQEIHLDFMQERISELELELEDIGWLRDATRAEFEFSVENILRMINWSRIMYLKNPLINHGVEVQADYVFAQGVSIASKKSGKFKDALTAFLNHPKNVAELFDVVMMWAKEVRLQSEGNIFFALFTTPGKTVVIRTIPVEEIIGSGDIIRNPQDRREPWYFKRRWRCPNFNADTGETTYEDRTDYYPDYRYNPSTKPETIAASKVHWDIRVMHIKVGGTDEMKYGLPETYQALPWARAAVRDLEDYASVKRALARFAWNVSVKGGKPAIAAVRTKLRSSVTSSEPSERNPAPAVASTWAGTEGYKLDPIRTAGAQPDSKSGIAIRVMVGTGLGIPDNILAGDASEGSLASAKSLDRPTELKFRKRQNLWAGIFRSMAVYSIANELRYTQSEGDGDYNFVEADSHKKITDLSSEFGLDINFPPILERDAAGRVRAVISAATLDGKATAGTMTDKVLVSLLAQALGMDNELDELLAKLKFDPDTDNLEKDELDPSLMLPDGSPGGPVPGPDAGAPLDRASQGLAKGEPSATPTEFPYLEVAQTDPDALLAHLRLTREAIERGDILKQPDVVNAQV